MAPSWQELSSGKQHWSVQPCVRPLSEAHRAAGHNVLRGSGPDQKLAFDNAMAQTGCPDRRLDKLYFTCCSSSRLSHHAAVSDAMSFTPQECGFSLRYRQCGSIFLGPERGVSDRDCRACWVGQGLDLGTKLLRERLYNTGSQSGFRLSKCAVGPTNSIISDGKLPICPVDVIGDDNPTVALRGRERMLYGVHDKLGRNQANALSLTGSSRSSLADDFNRDLPIVANHR